MAGTTTEDLLVRIRRLEEEVTRLRTAASPRADDDRAGTAAATGNISRSRFLRLGGAAAAGTVAAAASGLLSARPAGAATGDPLLLGSLNSASFPANYTGLTVPSDTQLATVLLWCENHSVGTGVAIPNARTAVLGTSSGPDSNPPGGVRVGVWGQTDQVTKGIGVVGRAGSTGADPLTVSGGPTGVIGTAQNGGIGVVGVSHGATGWGNFGFSDAGVGTIGYSTTGISLEAQGGGRFRQALRAAGAPTTGTFTKGEQIRDANGELFICVGDGTPGTWRRVAAVKEGFTGGSINLLGKPIRLLDTRLGGGAPLAVGNTLNLQVTGVNVGGLSVPTGALGVIGNVTVVNTGAPRGYLSLFPQGPPPSPLTASVNWFGADQILNVAVFARLNPTNGQMGIGNGLVGGSTPTHVVFDASGFII
jgi:hypothetical protein